MKSVYLAGPIAGQTDEQANGWRNLVIESLKDKYTFLNPMVRDFRDGDANKHMVEIVEGDKLDILASDVVFAYPHIVGVGTSMEILFAWERGIDVVSVVPYTPSPWIVYHSIIVLNSLDAGIYYMKNEYMKGTQ